MLFSKEWGVAVGHSTVSDIPKEKVMWLAGLGSNTKVFVF